MAEETPTSEWHADPNEPAPVYTQIAGSPGKLRPEDALKLARSGHLNAITEEEANRLKYAEEAKQLAYQQTTPIERAGYGLAQGASFGFALPAAIAAEQAIHPDARQKYLKEKLLGGLSDSTAYGAGELAGLIGTTVATAGILNPVEARVASLLPEATGILGSAAKTAVGAGARGSIEGSLLGLGSAVEDATIQNRALTSEAALASLGEGAAIGFGLGSVIGGTGRLVRSGIEVGGTKLSSYIDRRVEQSLLKSAGADVRALADAGITSETFLTEAQDLASRNGLKLGDPQLRNVARQNVAEFSKQRVAIAREVDRAATGSRPEWSNFTNNLREELIGVEALKPGGLGTAEYLENQLAKIAPPPTTGSRSFEKWVALRPNIVDAAKSLPAEYRGKVVHAYDAELRKALETAESLDPELSGVSGRYKAAESGLATSKVLGELLDRKALEAAFQPQQSGIRGLVGGALRAAAGHPVWGIEHVLRSTARGALADELSPAITSTLQKLNNSAAISKAVGTLKSAVTSSVKDYLAGSPAKLRADKPHILTDRTEYDREINRTYEAINSARDDRLKYYLQATGNLNLAEDMGKRSDNSIQYVTDNIPTVKNRKGGARLSPAVNSGPSLLPLPTLRNLDFQEHKYLRQHGVVKSPFGLLSNLAGGGKQEFETLAKVWPETHQLLVTEAQKQISKLAMDGGTLPMDKITQLSLLLDTPLVPALEPEYMQAVQEVYASQGQRQQQPPPTQQTQPPVAASLETSSNASI